MATYRNYRELEETSWHTHSLEETFQLLESDPDKGLSVATVQQRLRIYGPNEIVEKGVRTPWQIFLAQFQNLMLLLLMAVAIISMGIDAVALRYGGIEGMNFPFKDTIAIVAIIFLNAILGYLQEARAEKVLNSLKRSWPPRAKVLRDGQKQEVSSFNVVPGDILSIEAGDQICADGRLLKAVRLEVTDIFDGESGSVIKEVNAEQIEPDTPLCDRLNMVFSGTKVLQGQGQVIVTSTGMGTEIGKIAATVQRLKQEPTPLQHRMAYLGKIIVYLATVSVALVIIIITLKDGSIKNLQQLLEISLAMAVAVVPEGLPAVITLSLAIGTQAMVKRKALIRKLNAVETLGSINVICSDKTGTLTQNKMIVQEIQTMRLDIRVSGEGYTPIGDFLTTNNQKVKIYDYEELETLFRACLLCCNAHLTRNQGQWTIIGDPTEGALVVLAGKAGFQQVSLAQQMRRLSELPFTSERKRMSVIVRDDTVNMYYTLLFTKGSPEFIIEHCQYYQIDEQTIPLKESQKQHLLIKACEMAARGLRVIAFAYKPLGSFLPTEMLEESLIWLGLVGIVDPPRPETIPAIAKCKQAGIRPVMITGDHSLTARAIAYQLQIIEEEEPILTGKELEHMSYEELCEQVTIVNVYARVSPDHKLRIVEALQNTGHCVAMTGDGINDAPALKKADVGIAMGLSGTDISREASDMVLLDDNFATIIAAAEEGRVVHGNIRRFIKYILGSNIGEILVIAVVPMLGITEIPLTPLQILWLNLLTDGLPGLALAIEPPEVDVMKYPPIDPKMSIFAGGTGWYIIRVGIIFGITTIALMLWAHDYIPLNNHPETWKTMVFTTLCLSQMGHALALRSERFLTIEIDFFSNMYLLTAVSISILLQIMLIYIAPLRELFGLQILTTEQLWLCLGVSSLVFVWVEAEKLFLRWFFRSKCT